MFFWVFSKSNLYFWIFIDVKNDVSCNPFTQFSDTTGFQNAYLPPLPQKFAENCCIWVSRCEESKNHIRKFIGINISEKNLHWKIMYSRFGFFRNLFTSAGGMGFLEIIKSPEKHGKRKSTISSFQQKKPIKKISSESVSKKVPKFGVRSGQIKKMKSEG